jgi:hypothetical protein
MRSIGIITKYYLKFVELAAHFKDYGIICENLTTYSNKKIKKYLNITNNIAVIQEKSELTDNLTNNIITNVELYDNCHVTHTSYLKAFLLINNNVTIFDYKNITRGIINISKRISPKPEDCYDWDDVFIVANGTNTIYELKKLNSDKKVSSRDMTVSQFIQDHIYYKTRHDLYWEAQLFNKTIDFTKDPSVTMGIYNKYFDINKSQSWFFENFIKKTLNNGVYFRAPINRREKLYWRVGLNSGIPLTIKSDDPIHELVFMFHDCVHFNIPDLIYDGIHDDFLNKYVYTSYRLMSEVFALVTSDILFVNYLLTNGIDYPTVSDRKIYYMFQSINWSDFSIPNLRQIYHAIFQFGFFGLTSELENLSKNTMAIENFIDKYSVYWADDFKWTIHNWDHMVSQCDTHEKWWKQWNGKVELTTTHDFITQHKLSHTNLAENIFNIMFDQFIAFNWTNNIDILSKEQQLVSAFKKYICGQSVIFFKYAFLTESQLYWDKINNLIETLVLDIDMISNIIHIYNEYLNVLLNKRLIDLDDFNTFQSVYPTFKPLIVNYDKTNIQSQLTNLYNFMSMTNG